MRFKTITDLQLLPEPARSGGAAIAALATCCLLGAALPAAAGASSVDVQGDAVIYDGSDDANDLAVHEYDCSSGSGDCLVIDDSEEMELEPGAVAAGCEVAGFSDAECPVGLDVIRANLHGGADTLKFEQYDNPGLLRRWVGHTIVAAGTGNDILAGQDGPDSFFGNEGNDALGGDDGNDQLDGGDGNDTLEHKPSLEEGAPAFDSEPSTFGADNLVGGRGHDGVAYLVDGRTAGASLSLDNRANDGAHGEGDNLHSDIEAIEGTAGPDAMSGTGASEAFYGHDGNDNIAAGGGDDTVLGDNGNDSINGGAGRDMIRGYNGDDTIDGGPGPDSIHGDAPTGLVTFWAGDDLIRTRDGETDTVNCGLGADRSQADQLDVVLSTCETIERVKVAGKVGGPRRVRLSASLPRGQRLLKVLRRGLKVRIHCSQPCRASGELLVKAGLLARSVRVARGSKTMTRAGRTTLVLKFTAKAKRKLRRRRSVKGTMRVRATPLQPGATATITRRVKITR